MLTDADTQAIMLSLQVTAMACAVFVVPGVLLGVWLGKRHRPLQTVVQTLVLLPLVLPPVATGLILLQLVLWLHLPIAFTWWAAVLASGIVGWPLLVRTTRTAAEAIDPRLSLAAKSLGASRLRVLLTVTLPLCRRGIIGGLVLFAARAMGEFGAVMVVAGNTPGRTQTIPLAIYSRIESPQGGATWPLLLVTICLSLGAVAVSEWLARPRKS